MQLVMCAGTKDAKRKAFLERHIDRITCMPGIDEVCLIGSGNTESLIGNLLMDGVSYIRQEKLLLREEIQNWFSEKQNEGSRADLEECLEEDAEWYYQQFLTMQYARICKDEYYLIWSEDALPCRENRFWADDGKPFLDICTELYESEDDVIQALVPGWKRMIGKTFLSRHLLVNVKCMCDLLAKIEQNDAIAGKRFPEKVLNAFGRERAGWRCFRIEEMYGNYILQNHPEMYSLREWSIFRQGADLFDPMTISDRDFKWLASDFDAIVFEKDHSVREDNRGLFNNPVYQEKIRPFPLLQSAQGEYIETQIVERHRKTSNVIAEYAADEVTEEYRIYEEIGDAKSGSDPQQAWLSWQHARFLCKDTQEKDRLYKKMEQMGLSVPKAAIVIVSYNSKKMMRDCLVSIRRHSSEEERDIIVVDNASSDGVSDYLRKQSDITLICNTENAGFPRACNQGIGKAAEGEDIFFLNNDTRLTHNALYWLRMGLYASEDTGASGSISNYAGIGQILGLLLARPEDYAAYGRLKNVPLTEPYEAAKILCGFAMLVRRECIDRYGGMDEAFSPGYYEDTDLSLRLRSMGYRLRICKNSFIYHAGGQNFKKREDLDEITDRNLLYLAQRWGTDFMDDPC